MKPAVILATIGYPETLEQLREGDFCELFEAAFLRGFTHELLARCYAARAHSLGAFPLWRDFLLAVKAGAFDFMLMDHNQSLS